MSESEVVLRRAELADLQDRIYMLACAIDDVDRDLQEDASEATVRASLDWLLQNARSLVR